MLVEGRTVRGEVYAVRSAKRKAAPYCPPVFTPASWTLRKLAYGVRRREARASRIKELVGVDTREMCGRFVLLVGTTPHLAKYRM